MKNRLALLASLVCCLLLSCAGLEKPLKPTDTEYRSLKLEELKALAIAEPGVALETMIDILSSRPPAAVSEKPANSLAPSSVEALFSDTLRKLAKDFVASVEAEAWDKALAARRSLEVLARDASLSLLSSPDSFSVLSDSSLDEAVILEKKAKALNDRGLSLAALLVFRRSIEARPLGLASIDDEALDFWSKRAVILRNKEALRLFQDELKRRGRLPSADMQACLDSDNSWDRMKKGVVTIRVDRGIKIEQGIGIPDRVLGTGFYIDPAGYILTNYHVIESEVDPSYEGFSRLSIRPSDSPEDRIPAKVIGWDKLLDIALLKTELRPEFFFSLEGASALLKTGDKIYALGSPVGLENTLTSGIVSATGRRFLSTGEVLQVDAALNPGNSGGPLLDDSGRVVGIVFAGLPGYQGLNFAIPSSWILEVLPSLFEGGAYSRGWLGLGVFSGNRSESSGREELNVLYRQSGVGQAIKPGDILEAIDGVRITKIEEAQMLLLRHYPGEIVNMFVIRDGRLVSLFRSLTPRPDSPLEIAVKNDRKETLFPILFGMEVLTLPVGIFEPEAFTITKILPGSIADETGLSENDPFELKQFLVDSENRVILLRIHVKKRKNGFLDSIIQLPAGLDSPDFI